MAGVKESYPESIREELARGIALDSYLPDLRRHLDRQGVKSLEKISNNTELFDIGESNFAACLRTRIISTERPVRPPRLQGSFKSPHAVSDSKKEQDKKRSKRP